MRTIHELYTSVQMNLSITSAVAISAVVGFLLGYVANSPSQTVQVSMIPSSGSSQVKGHPLGEDLPSQDNLPSPRITAVCQQSEAAACYGGAAHARDALLHARRQAIMDSWQLDQLVRTEASNDDPRVVGLARALIDPPSARSRTIPRKLTPTPQDTVIRDYFNKQPAGPADQRFFVEVGALDGERSSNTILLESDLGWEGLLIEADSYMYTHLLGKNRRAWSINACINPRPGVAKITFLTNLAEGRIIPEDEVELHKKSDLLTVPCFTLETLLLALNRTRVDFFSLDVEGIELDVLHTINFTHFSIETLCIEYIHIPGGKDGLNTLMRSYGYEVLREVMTENVTVNFNGAHDMIYVRKK